MIHPVASGRWRASTHLFQRGCQYIETDVVYGVKEPLIVDFQKMPAESKAPTGETVDTPFYVIQYDFALQKATADTQMTSVAAE
jgi:hydroxyquinol 1,2-dioxygenase